MSISLGDTFGRLTVIGEASRGDDGGSRCAVRCACGVEKIVRTASLTRGCTRSCGCLRREVSAVRATKHRQNKTPEHRAWVAMVQRCTNPNRPQFKDWGGRGVTVCAEWLGDGGFERFLAHVGLRPSARHSIDRKDNARGYEPGNVRWATPVEQARNRRSTMLLTLNGRTQTATEWAEELGILYTTIRARRAKGWSDEMVLTAPVGRWAERS